MKKMILKIAALSLLAIALAAWPTTVWAQTSVSTNVPVVNPPPSTPAVLEPAPVENTNAPVKKHKKHDHSVFNGKLSAIDTNAMTLTVGERTFEITSETKITKDTLPATLADGVVGETIGGAFKKGKDGKLTATSISFNGKSEGEKKKKKKTHSDSTSSTTNSVPN
jgi:hypothetical protein